MAGDAATDIVTGERHQKLVGRSREMRACSSQGLAYGAKPDHQSTYAQLVIRRDGAQARVWIGLNSTIWDSNGDVSRVVTDAAAYQDVRAPGPGAEDASARASENSQLPAAAVCIQDTSARPPPSARLVSQPGPRMPASCLVLYGSYR